MSRNTSTGRVLEEMVLPALRRGGYSWDGETGQTPIGLRPGGRAHRVDCVARNAAEEAILISLKWQQSSGTAEQKIPFEVICLADAINKNPGRYKTAYLVLGGPGWTLRDWYVTGELRDHLRYADLVHVVTLEKFVALANAGRL